MTFVRHTSTGGEYLAFESPARGCGLCGGAGSLPDPARPLARRPCPRCSATPRARTAVAATGARTADAPLPEDSVVGRIVWQALVCSGYVSVTILGGVIVVAMVQFAFG